MIFKKVVVTKLGNKRSKKGKRVSILAKFHDQARPDKDIEYTLDAIQNAIIDRNQRKLETEGLEMGRDAVLAKYKELGITPPESRKNRRRQMRAFEQGIAP